MIEITEGQRAFCGACVAFCPVDCIELLEALIKIDHSKCTDCELCVFVCPIEVLSHVDE